MKKYQILDSLRRGLSFLLLCPMLAACGGPGVAETDAEEKRGYPSIGVGRWEVLEDAENQADDGTITICIDPGHGFDDIGCSSDYLTGDREEKDMTLLYAKELQAALEAYGYNVLLTHDGSSFPQEFNYNNNNKFAVDERAAYVNTLDIDYLVSLHCDTFEMPEIGGTRVYYYESAVKEDDRSAAIAKSVSDHLAKQFPAVKAPSIHDNEPYLMLRETTMAANLVEICFISNKTDAMNIQDADWQEKFIFGLAEGIHNYFSLYQQQGSGE